LNKTGSRIAKRRASSAAASDLIRSVEPRAPYLDALENSWIGSVCGRRVSDLSLTLCTDRQPGLLPQLFRRNGIHCDEIRGRVIRVSVGVHPEPMSRISTLRQAVRASKYDDGFWPMEMATGIGAIDRDGSFVNPHKIFALLVWHLAGTRKFAGRIAKNFFRHQAIDKLAEEIRPQLHEVPIGFKYICELMLEQNI